MMFCLDLYELDPQLAYLDRAKLLADLSINTLWKDRMFSRHTGETVYETQLGSSRLSLAFIRLHLVLEKEGGLLSETDWSFWAVAESSARKIY